jgi:hypothetical protein
MFSEPYESDVLWVKLNIEDPGIDEWIIVENSYTFQGDFKGHFLNDILKNDKRFDKFLHKIKVIETSHRFSKIDQNSSIIDNEKVTFNAEFLQRESSKKYILENYSSKDWLFLSDTDECLDLTNGKKKILLKKIKDSNSDIIKIPRVKYIYDFNNKVIANRSTPIVRLDNKLINYSNNSFGELRKNNINGTKRWSKEMIFEYSFCFSKEGIEKKLNSFSHTGAKYKQWKVSLELNCLPTRSGEIPNLKNSKSWNHIVPLNKSNSPQFVIDNFSILKTKIINPNFKKNRKRTKPEYFNGINGIKVKLLFIKQKMSIWKSRLDL